MGEHSSIRTIGVYCLSGVGNIILFTPALQQLSDRYPNAKIYFMTLREANYEFIRYCPYVTPIFLQQTAYNSMSGNFEVLRQCFKLRKLRFDVTIPVFPCNRLQYGIIAAILGGKLRLGFDFGTLCKTEGKAFFNLFAPVERNLHDVEQNLHALRALGIACNSMPRELLPRYWSTETHKQRGLSLFQEVSTTRERVIVYHPTCFTDMVYKRWPPEHFAALIDKIAEHGTYEHALLGAEDERMELEALAELCRHKPKILCGEELLSVAEFLRHCHLMVSNDSGLMHLAMAAGTKTVGIFGPTLASRTRPWGKNGYVIQSRHPELPCRMYPFGKDKYPKCCGGKECMRSIAPEEVFEFLVGNNLI